MSPQSGISTARAQQAQGLLRGMADPATSGLAIEAGTTEAIAAKSSVAVVIGAENSGDNGWSPSFGAQDCRFVAGSFGYSLYNPADPAFDSSHDISIQRAGTILAGYTLASRPDLSRSGLSASAALPSLPDGVRVSADKQTVVILDTGVSSAIDNLIYQYDFYAHDSSAATTETHGSIVASQVLAADSEANIVMLKVAADGSGTISLAAADAALDWVAKYAQQLNIAAVNLSFGASSVVSRETVTSLSDEFETLSNLDVAVVVAAGNSGARSGVSALASDSNVICVSASDGEGTFASFSNRDADLTDLVADGMDIAYMGSVVSGTSFSAPLVAGAIAEVKSEFYASYGHELSSNEALHLLQATGDALNRTGEVAGTSASAGSGYVELDLTGALGAVYDLAALAALGIVI